MRRLCTICARGGSKGLPGKNLRELFGRPLLAHSIVQARASGIFAAIGVSSDSEEILEVARRFGADHLVARPLGLASDEAPKLEAIHHCFSEIERKEARRFDTLVDLDVTSPLRTRADIVHAVELLETSGAPNVITGVRARRSPYFNLVERASDGTVRLSKSATPPITRRQDAPACFDMNASIYVWQGDAFRASPSLFQHGTRLYEMPEERSFDIDSELDFRVVEMLMRDRSEEFS